jgi:hypothetical protein
MLDLFGRTFALLGFGADRADVARLLAAAEQRGVPLAFTAIDHKAAADLYARKLVLVRPDGHVGWRGDRAPDDPLAVIDRVRGCASLGPQETGPTRHGLEKTP